MAGNPETNSFVKEGLIYMSINEQYSLISYTAGKFLFEELYKDLSIPKRSFIKASIVSKSLLK